MSFTFSVVIPTYNQATYLQSALTSVIQQTFEDFEIIVINNHSQDHTLDVMNQFSDNRLRLINFHNNGIIAAARNIGIKESKGKYVAFLDSDDLWSPNKLEMLHEKIQSEPQHCVYSHDYQIISTTGKRKYVQCGPKRKCNTTLYKCLLLNGNVLSTSGTVVHREILNKVGCFSEDVNLVTVEDYDLWLRLAQFCTFKFVNQNLGSVTRHESNASGNVELHLKNTLHLFNTHLNNLKAVHGIKRIPNEKWRRSDILYGAARQHYAQNNLQKAITLLGKSVRTYPFHIKTYIGVLSVITKLMFRSKRYTD